MANIGINLVEVDGKATPSIQGAATSRAGFIGGAVRGVPGVVRTVTNFTEYAEYFGRFHAKYVTPHALRGFFDNGGALAFVARVFPGTGGAATKTSSDNTQAAGNGPLKIEAGYRGQLDPGLWGNQLKVHVTYRGGNPAAFDLRVELAGKEVEVWSFLPATAAAVGKINDEFTGSKFIKLTWIDNKIFNQQPETITLAGGDDKGTLPVGKTEDEVMEAGCIAALQLFETVDLQLLTCPDVPDAGIDNMLGQAKSFCFNRGDCIYIAHTKDNLPVSGNPSAQKWGSDNRSANLYVAAYWPWIRVQDPDVGSRWVPPTGHVMGVMARTDQQRGVWKAPAGNQATVMGALDVRTHISDTNHNNLVKDGSVNAVRFVSGQGIIVDSARTMSTNVLWQYVNVRLLFNFVKSSLKAGLRWVVYEPNDDILWKKIKHNSVTPFLMGLWRRGAFGPGSPEQVFSVQCDATNNSSDNVKLGILNVEIYFYPSRPAETFILTVGQQEGGASASES